MRRKKQFANISAPLALQAGDAQAVRSQEGLSCGPFGFQLGQDKG